MFAVLPNKLHRKLTDRGFTLAELLIGLVIIVASLLVILNAPRLISTNTKSTQTSFAKDIAAKQIDTFRNKTYENLIGLSTGEFTDPSLVKLKGSCSGHACGSFEVIDCPPDICPNSLEEVKQVKVRVTWNGAGGEEHVEVVTLVGKGGNLTELPDIVHETCVESECISRRIGGYGINQSDRAMSFMPTFSGELTKISVMMQKFGNPSYDLPVFITGDINSDGNGVPDKDNILAETTIPYSVFSFEFKWMDVELPTPVMLTANTRYWIVLDGNVSPTDHWFWRGSSTDYYPDGYSVISNDWKDIMYVQSYDYFFKVYMTN